MSSSPEDNGCPVFWFSGLSGAGKTTVAEAVSAEMKFRGLTVAIFDGDDVRRNRKIPLGFSRRHVLINNAEIAVLCRAGRARRSVAASKKSTSAPTGNAWPRATPRASTPRPPGARRRR